jgi:multiple sugar transport system substrate-binding protein
MTHARRYIYMAAAIGGLLSLAACGGSNGTSQSQTTGTSPVTIQFWNAYNTTDAEASTMQHVVIPAFEKQNPGITVDSVVYPYASLLQKFIAAAAAGDPPDVMRSDIIWVPQLASQGILLNMSSLPWYPSVASQALPGPLATTKWNGTPYALPLDTNTQALFWNKADFKAAGITAPPATLAQLAADAAKLTVKSKQQYGLGVDGTDIWNVAPYIWSAGGGFTNSGNTSASGVMDGAATTSEVSQLVRMLNSGYIGTDFKGGAGGVSGETGFPKGEYAMYLDGPWAVPTYQTLKPPPQYGISMVPAGAGGSISTVGGEDLVIPRDARHLAAAEKFARFLVSPFAQLAMARAGQMSALSTIGGQEVAATPYYAIFVKQLQTARARPVTPAYTKLDTDFSNELGQILAGKVSVPAGLSAAAQQANAALASP